MEGLEKEVAKLKENFATVSELNDKLAKQNIEQAKTIEDLSAKHEEALALHAEAVKLAKNKPATDSIAKAPVKKETVKLSGKTVAVEYKGKKAKAKLKVPAINYDGNVLTEADALANAACMKFLVEETVDKNGKSPFIELEF